jgi:hypothetical protein
MGRQYLKVSFILLIVCSMPYSAIQDPWTICSSGTASNLRGIAWNGMMYVVVGDTGATLTSPDGKNWTDRTSTSHCFNSITWGAENYLAVAERFNWKPTVADMFGYYQIFRSDDGIRWDSATEESTHCWQNVRRVNDKFIAIQSGLPILQISLDGSAWTSRSIDTFSCPGPLDVAFGKNNFVTVGGYSWDFPNGWLGILYSGMLYSSIDCSTWTDRTPAGRPVLTSIIWVKDKFVAAGFNGSIYTSADGTIWTRRSSGTSASLWSISWGDDIFVAVGENGTILSSSDGINWSSIHSGTMESLKSITWGDHQFIAVGANGTILTSSSTTAVISEHIPMSESEHFSLSGNTLRYTIPASSKIQIKLIDIKGRLAQALVDGNRPAGVYSVQIPHEYAPGLYLLFMQIGKTVYSKSVCIK